MDLKAIGEILSDGNLPDTIKRMKILTVLAEHENAIGYILIILSEERRIKKELISGLSNLLAKADYIILNPILNEPEFITQEIAEFYENNKKYITNSFKKQ